MSTGHSRPLGQSPPIRGTKKAQPMKGSAFFGGAGGYCPHVRLITCLHNFTGIYYLNFVSAKLFKNSQKRIKLKSVSLDLGLADHQNQKQSDDMTPENPYLTSESRWKAFEFLGFDSYERWCAKGASDCSQNVFGV